jgi:tetratricopeptide (TPR) repeat protein/LysM repeat protein
MRLRSRNWIAAVAAMAGLAVANQPLQAKETSDPVQIGSFSGAFLAARVAETDNDLGGAAVYYRRALEFDPANKQLQQSLMLALISQGRFDESLPFAEKLKSEPEVERFSRLALAVDAIRHKKYGDAETWLKLALQSDLDRLITGLMTGWAKLGAGDAKDALAYLDDLKGPEWYSLFVSFHKALIADNAGLGAEAGKAYQATIDNVSAGGAAPETWVRAAEAYAGFLVRQGDKDKALEILSKADELVRGRLPIAALREDIEKGRPVPQLIAGPTAGSTEVLLDLATALNHGGGETFVRLYLQYALALEPRNDQALIQLASLAEQQKNAEEAIALYREIPDTSPMKRIAEMQLGLNLADLDRHDEAIVHLKKLLDSDPDDMRAYLALGSVYASKEDYKSAADIYDRAVAKLPEPTVDNWNIFYQRGIAYERLKQWPKAEPNFKKALELYPDQPQVMNYLGYSWVDMNIHLDEGLKLIQRAVDLRPSDGYIVDSLGWAYYRLGRYEDAARELERAVSLKPEDPVLNDHLGDAYWRVGRKLEATFQWSHARDMKPDPEILESVNQKLLKGLPPVSDKATAEKAPASAPEPKAEPATPAAPAIDDGRKSEAAEPERNASVEAAASAIQATYKVQSGQSLWSIAVDKLGSGRRYIEILDLNPQLGRNPGRLVPGQELLLPTLN